MLYSLVQHLPATWAHHLSGLGLHLYSEFCGTVSTPQWRPFTWQNCQFKNPMGIAGGVDKNAEYLNLWPRLGCGFIEIGTVTPRPQKPNPGKIVDRDWVNKYLWNKMGFPSLGADEVFFNLHNYKQHQGDLPVFVNIGKNRDTDNSRAHEDYMSLVERLHSVADCFVVNISSPNTKGLRELQEKANLEKFLTPITKLSPKPVLLKLSPDQSEQELESALKTSLDCGIQGFVLTNTTLSRPEPNPFPTEGGVSGAFVQDLSIRALRKAKEILQNESQILLVSAGGIMSSQDVRQRLELGAHLVQSYSGLVFHGPGFFLNTLAELADGGTKYSGKRNKQK